MLRDPGQHLGPELIVIVKGEDVVRPALASQGSVGARFSFDGPADAKQRRQHSPRLRSAPGGHAALKVTLSGSGAVSAWSRRSAMTRSARA